MICSYSRLMVRSAAQTRVSNHEVGRLAGRPSFETRRCATLLRMRWSKFKIGPSSPRLLEDLPADQHPPDLAGAGADLVELGVAQHAAGRIVLDGHVAGEA